MKVQIILKVQGKEYSQSDWVLDIDEEDIEISTPKGVDNYIIECIEDWKIDNIEVAGYKYCRKF